MYGFVWPSTCTSRNWYHITKVIVLLVWPYHTLIHVCYIQVNDHTVIITLTHCGNPSDDHIDLGGHHICYIKVDDHTDIITLTQCASNLKVLTFCITTDLVSFTIISKLRFTLLKSGKFWQSPWGLQMS